MADTLHPLLPEKLVTKQDLINENFAIGKKFVMIDSRAYTPEAFEYVLKLADLVGSLVFVYDSKKIWANGRYFGGDIFQEDLNYFTEFASIDTFGNFTGIIQANHPKELIKFKGINYVEVIANHDPETGENLMTFDYNLKGAVNTERVEIDGAKYNLVVENGRVKLNQYKPMVVTLSSLPPLEFDSVEDYATVSFRIYISGTLPDPSKIELKVNIETEDGSEVENYHLDEDTNTFTADVPVNVNTKFTVYFTDGETAGTVSVWQKWGYGILIGLWKAYKFEYIFDDNDYTTFEDLYDFISSDEDSSLCKKDIWVPGTRYSSSANIDVSVESYGIVICPSNMEMEFTDTSINLVGGWQPSFNKTGYKYLDNNRREFIVWRTDHQGIGLVNWKIIGEEIKNTEEDV